MDTRERLSYIAVIAALGVLAIGAGMRVSALTAALEARPAIRDSSKVAKSKATHRGATRTVTTSRVLPDGTKEKRVQRDVASEDVAVASVAEKAHSEVPACAPPERRYDRYLGLKLDPFSPTKVNGGRAAMTVFRRVEMGVEMRWEHRAKALIGSGDLGWRF